jgi:hypothetical protein
MLRRGHGWWARLGDLASADSGVALSIVRAGNLATAHFKAERVVVCTVENCDVLVLFRS